jgi:hypothetical protein
MIAFFSGDFQLETTFERMGKGTLKIDHGKEEYLFYNWFDFGRNRMTRWKDIRPNMSMKQGKIGKNNSYALRNVGNFS